MLIVKFMSDLYLINFIYINRDLHSSITAHQGELGWIMDMSEAYIGFVDTF